MIVIVCPTGSVFEKIKSLDAYLEKVDAWFAWLIAISIMLWVLI